MWMKVYCRVQCQGKVQVVAVHAGERLALIAWLVLSLPPPPWCDLLTPPARLFTILVKGCLIFHLALTPLLNWISYCTIKRADDMQEE